MITITQVTTFPLPGGFYGLLTTLEPEFTRLPLNLLLHALDGLKPNKCLCSLTAGLEMEHVEVVIYIELEDIASVSPSHFLSLSIVAISNTVSTTPISSFLALSKVSSRSFFQAIAG